MKSSVHSLAGIVLAGSALFAAGCRHQGDSAAGTAATPAQVATAQVGNISQVLTLAGQFQPYQVVDVHPKVSGYMANIRVDIGDVVHRGQVLATLEVPELKAQLAGAAFDVQQSEEEIRRAQREIERAEAQHYPLHVASGRLAKAAAEHPGLIAQQELDDYAARDRSAEAQVDAAKSAMASAQQHMGAARAERDRVQALSSYTNVTAPLDGVVVWRYADTGALIQGGTNTNDQALPIVRLAQSQLLRLRMPVPEDDVHFVHDGDPIEVRVDAVGRSFTGHIVRTTRDVSLETRTMETEVDLENKDLSIAPGMYANTMLQLGHAEHVITVPVEAIENKDGHSTVYVVDDSNHAHLREVVVGLSGSHLAEVRSGLKAGDRVLVSGLKHVVDGEQISPLPIATESSESARLAGGMVDLKQQEGGTH